MNSIAKISAGVFRISITGSFIALVLVGMVAASESELLKLSVWYTAVSFSLIAGAAFNLFFAIVIWEHVWKQGHSAPVSLQQGTAPPNAMNL